MVFSYPIFSRDVWGSRLSLRLWFRAANGPEISTNGFLGNDHPSVFDRAGVRVQLGSVVQVVRSDGFSPELAVCGPLLHVSYIVDVKAKLCRDTSHL